MNGHVVEEVFTVPRVIVHADDVEQGRLAGAGRPHDRHELTRLDVEINAPQHKVLRQSLREIFFDVAKADHWTSVNPLSLNSFLASSISRRFAPASSSTIKPSNRCTMRSACCAYRGSCVTMQMVAPPRCSSLSSSITASPFVESRFPVGSSASRMLG